MPNKPEKTKHTPKIPAQLQDFTKAFLEGAKKKKGPKDKNPAMVPSEAVLPVIPIREGVLFPSTESVLTFGRPLSINAIRQANSGSKLVVLVTQRKPKIERPRPDQLYNVGTLATVEKMLNTDGTINALVKGIGRVSILDYVQTNPSLIAHVSRLKETISVDEEMKALIIHLQKEFRRAVHMGKPVEFLNFMKLMSGVSDGELVDQIASTLNVSTKDKQKILETMDVKKRMKLVTQFLAREMKVLEIEKDVVHKTQKKFDKNMRENVLRERLKTIQKELDRISDKDGGSKDGYEAKLKKAKFEPDVEKRISKEIKRLNQMSVNNPEGGYIRTWLDTIFELPWNTQNRGRVSIEKAQQVLDKNHYGLSEVKDRVMEFMAVLELKKSQKKKTNSPTILCFVGPPGVGKTSIGRSIAQALGRKFVKVSLGGIRDEAEIRGHRRTYVGAMPGRIISGIKQAKSKNPVYMLDEIDKVGNDFRGDPSAALLEALDPEQNHTFHDHYLDIPFDLSQVMFIATANTLTTIPPALRDRLEIIPYSGYTEEEKFMIAKKYLLKKTVKSNGLTNTQVKVPDSVLHKIIKRYTREAGVRDLERNLGKILRKVALSITKAKEKSTNKSKTIKKRINVTLASLKDFLGPEKFDVTFAEDTDSIGLATGLAWTSVGGDVLFIEVALTPGKGAVKLTGTLGDVMKESAQAALTYVKANSKDLGIEDDRLKKTDVHIHVPEGAVPKDGPSAGITITTAIVSAFTKKPVVRNIAMTGEVTLRGRVLRIGGLKEKSIAAHRAGCKLVIIPKANERDLVKIPDSVKKDIKFKPVSQVDEVLKLALEKKPAK